MDGEVGLRGGACYATRMRFTTNLIIAALMLTSTAAVGQMNVGVDANQKVREFYGVPLDLKLWDLKMKEKFTRRRK